MFCPQEGAGGKRTEEGTSQCWPVCCPRAVRCGQSRVPLTSSSQLCPGEGLALEMLGMNWTGYSQTKTLRTMGAATQLAQTMRSCKISKWMVVCGQNDKPLIIAPGNYANHSHSEASMGVTWTSTGRKRISLILVLFANPYVLQKTILKYMSKGNTCCFPGALSV